MKPRVKVSSPIDATAKIKADLAKLARKRVLVGIPEDHNNRKGGEVTNASLLYLHTHGSPLQHVPPRPVIEPAIEAGDNKSLITRKLGEAARAALDGKTGATNQALGEAGTLGSNAAKRWFTDPRNGWAPNAPATIARKGSDQPLIDTGQLRRSITYLVDEK